MVLVGCGTALYQATYFIAVLWVGVSVATVVSLGLAPVLAAAADHLRAGSRPDRREVLVLLAALGGLALISSQAGGTDGPRPVAGLLLAVLAGAVYAATTVLGHGLAQRVETTALTTCATAVSAVVLAPFLVIAGLSGDALVPDSSGSWVLLVYLGVATMALAYALLYAGLRTTSGSAATVATLVEPLSAALLAALILDEVLTAAALVGGVLLLAAVVALHRPEEHPAPV
ncbi:DMT family transporter [Nocardioides alcanivorans]|uniref:DMT family transporter n=1 Tax=Nocardioides alcanivorans TaxID=2897352 RepID=UPI001F1B835E|nr:EamA family transporter [Nocardioides alcanivorans]